MKKLTKRDIFWNLYLTSRGNNKNDFDNPYHTYLTSRYFYSNFPRLINEEINKYLLCYDLMIK